jgi:hypothetical protein
MALTVRFRNLLALPSHHYHPVFGREAIACIARFRPTAIALEITESWAAEFEWGIGLWPSPVVSYAGTSFLPVVAGDSMVEACRMGRAAGIPIFYIDRALADPIERPHPECQPDAALAARVGRLFLDAMDALTASAGPPAAGDLAREAHMAGRLADLMQRDDRVLWVGGMAHWSRIRASLKAMEYEGPRLAEAGAPPAFHRMCLDASALHRMTQRLPFQVAHFARQPTRYEESRCLRTLALAAVKPEKIQSIDVAAMLLYARNLEAQESFSESPGLWPLLTAASACLGNEYASRLVTLALRDRHTPEAEQLPLLTYTIEAPVAGKAVGVYRSEGQVLAGEPLWGHPVRFVKYRRLPSAVEIKRRERNNPAAEVAPAGPNEPTAWVTLPDEEVAYEAFVRYVLEHVTSPDLDETTPTRLLSGMGEGLDVRATIRHWHEGEIYVREPVRTPRRVTNGLIDYTSSSEDAAILQRKPARGGWVDPDLQNVGSASWQVGNALVLQKEPLYVYRQHRDLSLITLDAPTWVRTDDSRSFYTKVILPLIHLRPAESNLYAWLRIMFQFCRRKPFAYCSRYIPGPRIHAIAREFGVHVIHVPLRRIPQRMLDRHQTFPFMEVTRRQWDELVERIREGKRAWVLSEAAG